jgi:hypothetical protein
VSPVEPNPDEYPTLREVPTRGGTEGAGEGEHLGEPEYPTLRETEIPDPGPDPFAEPEHPTLRETPIPTAAPTSAQPAAPRRAAFDRADPTSIGAGIVFFLIGGAYLLASGGHLTVNAGWTLSLLLLGLGLSGVVGALLRARRGNRPDQ